MKTLIITLIAAFQIATLFAQDTKSIENLGYKVNSQYHELAPVISADGKVLYFVRTGHPSNTLYKKNELAQDIWFCIKDKYGKWGMARHESAEVNSRISNSVCWVSADGNRMLIIGGYNKKNFTGEGFSMCVHSPLGWSPPQQLEIEGFDEMIRGQFYGASMANDAKTLILYFSEKEEKNANDLYVSFLIKGNKWTRPVKIGNQVSTDKFNEMTPFIAPDGVTLYFASDRKGGLGDMDIWKTTRLDDTWLKWSEPVNVGAPINTKGWDAFFTLDANGDFAYMVTTKASRGGADVVRIKMKEEDKPNPVVLVYGNVHNAKTKEPISAGLQYEILPEGIIAGYAYSNPGDGSYKIVLPYGKNYSFMAAADNFLSVSENINLDTASGYREVRRDLYLVPFEVGQTIRLNNIFFDYGNAMLRAESYPELDRIVTVMNENLNLEIEISGHTDNLGTSEDNLLLSEQRANAVRNYLVTKKIAGNRIIAKGYGETKPIAGNDSDADRQQNRRVEFTITKK